MNKTQLRDPGEVNVLIACEESQAECNAFRALGFNAYSCDIQECRKGTDPDTHIVADVTPYLRGKVDFVTQLGTHKSVPKWDLIIAHPPCTYLCKVGSVWLYKEPDTYLWRDSRYLHLNSERFGKMQEARKFFFECLQAKADFLAVENPLPMALAELPRPSCYASPHWYGVKYTKKTLYWLRNLPPLMPEKIHSHPKSFCGASRGKYRSRTFPELANAIARQWGGFILSHPL